MTAPHPFTAIRRAGVPIVAIETADPVSTIAACRAAMNGSKDQTPCAQWDCIRGLKPVNQAATALCSAIGDPIETTNGAQCLSLIAEKYLDAKGNDPGAVWFFHAGNRALEDWTAAQAVWNLRDILKSAGSTLVLLGPAFRIPAELKHDCVVISEELPGDEALGEVVKGIASDAEMKIEDDQLPKMVDTLRGLSAFAAEQVVAMSIVRTDGKLNVDTSALWERKRKMIEQTPGLGVWRGGERFADIGGCDSIKAYLRDYMRGPAGIRAIVFLDELEKSMAGSGGGDLSGVSSDFLGQILTYMQDSGSRGMIFVGPPGAAKSAMAKCAGNEANVPTIALDMGGMKGSLVGQSEATMRNALKVITAVSSGKALWIATCNSLAVLPPELKRRFSLGTWFFDCPTAEERAAIWNIYAKQYAGVVQDIGPEAIPGWTGAEIRALFDTAWATGRPLSRAVKIIVPVCKAAADKIEALRSQAVGKFTNAGVEGIYCKPETDTTNTGRKLQYD